MRLAVTVWGNRISPLCNAARQLSVYEVKAGRIADEYRVSVSMDSPLALVAVLKTQAVDVLICGAISESLAALIRQASIQVMAFISGEITSILDAFVNHRLDSREFKMPGVGNGRRHHFKRGPKGWCSRTDNLFNL